MSKPNHIQRVTLIVETADGEQYTLVSNRPGPLGGNPAFMGQQLDSAVVELGNRGREIIDAACGAQIFV